MVIFIENADVVVTGQAIFSRRFQWRRDINV